jgi:hypothetical protein
MTKAEMRRKAEEAYTALDAFWHTVAAEEGNSPNARELMELVNQAWKLVESYQH